MPSAFPRTLIRWSVRVYGWTVELAEADVTPSTKTILSLTSLLSNVTLLDSEGRGSWLSRASSGALSPTL
jgi:hypothetical protein